MTPVPGGISSAAGFGVTSHMASYGSMLIIPVPTAATNPVVKVLWMHQEAADSVVSLAAAVFGCKRAASPWEQPCYFRPLCAAHILPASPEARYANYTATASEKDSARRSGVVLILTKWNSLFWTVKRSPRAPGVLAPTLEESLIPRQASDQVVVDHQPSRWRGGGGALTSRPHPRLCTAPDPPLLERLRQLGQPAESTTRHGYKRCDLTLAKHKRNEKGKKAPGNTKDISQRSRRCRK